MQRAIAAHCGEAAPAASLALKDFLHASLLFGNTTLVLILDQFEEFFNYHRHSPALAEFVAELADAGLYVEPPHLQIVCMQLWESDHASPDKRLSRATYANRGRAAGLLRSYFQDKMRGFGAAEKKFASGAFDHLVSGYGTKMARPLDELARVLNADPAALQATLDKLEQARILRRQLRARLSGAAQPGQTSFATDMNRVGWVSRIFWRRNPPLDQAMSSPEALRNGAGYGAIQPRLTCPLH